MRRSSGTLTLSITAIGLAVAACGGSRLVEEPRPTSGASRSEPLRLAAVYPAADPNALAVDADETRLFAGEGASVAILDLDALCAGEEALLARIPVDAAILDLLHAGEALWVAGGTQGLLRLDLAAGEPVAAVVDAVPGKVCIDLARSGERLLALFAARDASELRVYALDAGVPLGAVDLPLGTSFAVAARGGRAWVAMGHGGVARVDLEVRPPVARTGPSGTDAFPPPAGFRLRGGMVRDVAVSDTHVHLAADGAGLASLALEEAWGPTMPVTSTPLEIEGRVTYACRIACDGERVAVGTNLAPVQGTDGAPFTAFGWMDHDLRVGAMAMTDFPVGRHEGLLVFRTVGAELVHEVTATADGAGWRTLILRGDRVYEQHVGIGTRVRSLDGADSTILARRRPRGLSAIDGVLGRNDPGLVLFGSDHAGSRPVGWLRVTRDDELVPVPGTAHLAPLGLVPQAHWIDPRSGAEWCLSGEDRHWILVRVDAEAPERSTRWLVRPPDVPGEDPGHTYLLGTYERGHLLLTRAATTRGFLGVEARELVDRALGSAPGAELSFEPSFVITTHPGGDPPHSRSWRTRVHTARDGRRIAAVAEGFDSDPESPTYSRPQIGLYDVTAVAEERGGESVRLLARAHGSRPRGHAMALEIARVGQRDYAFVADFAQGLHVFDVTRPEDPRLVGGWSTPPAVFDGNPDHALDLVLESGPGGGRLHVWIAAGRLGLVRIDVSDPERFTLEPDTIIDTPGWAAGIAVGHDERGRFLLLGDQKAGLRLYR